MSSKYSVIQYVPDPVIDERINIGVLVFGQGQVLTHFIKNWRRVRQFGNEDISFLKDFANGLEKQVSKKDVDDSAIEKMIGSWTRSIQFTEPRASLQDPAELVMFVASRFLKEQKAEETVRRKRARDSGVRKLG